MTTQCLYNWNQYLSDEDYNYLIQYIENIKNNNQNNKMIILSGPSRTGKSTLHLFSFKTPILNEYIINNSS